MQAWIKFERNTDQNSEIKLSLHSFYVENLIEKICIGVERAKKEGKYKGEKKGETWKRKNRW